MTIFVILLVSVYKHENRIVHELSSQCDSLWHICDSINQDIRQRFHNIPEQDDYLKPYNSYFSSIYSVCLTRFDIIYSDGRKRQIVLSDNNIELPKSVGFLLNNGMFFTARIIIEPWHYWPENIREEYHSLINNGGHLVASFSALSPSGCQHEFTSDDFSYNTTCDNIYFDYAYTTVGNSFDGLDFDAEKSRNLEIDDFLFVLGSYIKKNKDTTLVKPIIFQCRVDNITKQKTIISDLDADQYYGCPVFYKESSGKMKVIGLYLPEGIIPIYQILY